jgi:membrane protein DedA with SNARE-associated domain
LARWARLSAPVIYYLAKLLERAAILRYGRYVKIGEQELQKTERWFSKYGPLAVFSARMVPGIRELISIPAGIGDMYMLKFIAYTFAGSLVWSVALTLTGFYLGEAWSRLVDQLSTAFTIVSVVVLAAVVLGCTIWYLQRRKKGI